MGDEIQQIDDFVIPLKVNFGRYEESNKKINEGYRTNRIIYKDEEISNKSRK